MMPPLAALRPALAALALAACAPTIGFGRATPLAPGTVAYSGGVETSVLRADLRDDRSAPIPWMQLQTGVHVGVTDGVEVGGRAWGFGWPGVFTTVGAAADAKVRLHSARFRGDPHVATGMSLSWQSPALGNTPWTVLGVTVPLLVGFDVKESHLVFGPRVAGWYVGAAGQEALWTPGVGAGVGWSAKKGRFELFPELTWMYAPVTWAGAIADPARVGAHSFQAGLGMAWHTPAR